SLRYIVQQNQNDIAIIKGRYQMEIRYIESVNGFTVTPVCNNHFSIFMARQNRIAHHLELQINNGRSFAQISQDFMLQLSSNIGWQKGVFVKNALNSNICTLYDKSAFMNLTREHLPHPLSREKIVKEMIIERNMCYFDTISQHFIIMDADQQKQHCK
ncbi:DUF1076 domain-containing protein, partial [Escherichia coli]|nr:DUF1076 domain-containing protein [Escherichia coli]